MAPAATGCRRRHGGDADVEGRLARWLNDVRRLQTERVCARVGAGAGERQTGEHEVEDEDMRVAPHINGWGGVRRCVGHSWARTEWARPRGKKSGWEGKSRFFKYIFRFEWLRIKFQFLKIVNQLWKLWNILERPLEPSSTKQNYFQAFSIF